MIFYILGCNLILYTATCVALDYARNHKFFGKWFDKESQPMSMKDRRDAIKTSMTNVLLSSLGVYVVYPYINISNHYHSIINECLKFSGMLLLSDMMFYFTHRLMHLPQLYKFVHKKHHQHIHTNVWSSFYFSKSELLSTWLFVLMLPIVPFNPHYFTFGSYLTFVMLSLVKSHSGINIKNTYTSKYHDIHHLKFNVNYGTQLKVWDNLFGTSAVKDR